MIAGWIRIYRQIDKHWIWENESYLKAWLTILLKVNYENKKVLVGETLIDCKRGQSLYSLSTWVKIFGGSWTIQKTRTFFKLLENDKMVNIEGLQKTTRLTVLNYDTYQSEQQANNTPTTDNQQAANKQLTITKEREEYKEDIKKEDVVEEDFEDPRSYKKTLLSEIGISDAFDSQYLEIALSFQKLFRSNLEDAGASTSIVDKAKGTWIDDIRLMIEKDGYSLTDLRDVYKFLQKDDFWKQNILSTKKLREKMPQLKLKMHNGKNRGNNKEATSLDQLAEILKHSFEEG